jgi:hypothetical protein
MDLTLDEWLATVEDEYLRQFITQGGAAVKFAVVPSAETSRALQRALIEAAVAQGCQAAVVDAAATRIHMIDQVFFAVARQVNWDALALAVVRDVLAEARLFVPTGEERLTYSELAALNQEDEFDVRRLLRTQLRRHVGQDFAMAPEFRVAMIRLCQAQLETDEVDLAETAAIRSWLRGELRLISAVKRAGIFQKIGRHNARAMILSLAHWLRRAGRAGFVLVLDLSRYLATTRPADGSLYHTPTTVLDAYEVLRQFIDTTDELEGCLIVAIAPHEFLDDPRRGLERYAPLQTRISDEVQDRNRANPLAALVRLRDVQRGYGGPSWSSY